MNTQKGSVLPDMTKLLNQSHLITMHSRGLFLSIVLYGSKVHAQFDPGSNMMIILDTLATDLGFVIIRFQATFRKAAGANGVC